ncbi:hypothetical protein [Brevibacillus sp. NL20B1]|uniref:hypothetical protein n=1 Tax=Brevibacillus sp. NL20B1 TaxID=2829799 RepID=UPI001B8EC9F4|nr:hypothetical protein [Brevibacillus sp. NL20B1]MBR8661143.1 hypothetical protein [Brevibacillus sp. NL20B1]
MKRKSNDTTTKHFRGQADYKSAFSAAVTEFIANMISPELRQLYEKKRETERADDTDGLARVNAEIMRHRTERSRAINALIDEYIASTGERPDGTELERLANAVLHEELTDPSVWKAKHAEYPFFSEIQLERRTNRDDREEAASLEATDGKCYRKPTRRKRSPKENAFMDRTVKSRNKQRREQYRKDTRPGEVVTYNIRELTTNSDIFAL